ncbi:MAG: TetR/AcrR family transcriptional regulator [Armatimonadetes bacterium]|nr:TetR/AcrR family transcriptional regulator [Armatimonadota bacterium]
MGRLTAQAKSELVETRRRQILEAAAEVFSARGYHDATMREVAAAAGLAQGTLYLYFPGKRELLLAVWDHLVIRSLAPLLEQAGPADLAEFFKTVLRNRLQILEQYAPLMRLVYHIADHDETFRAALIDRLEQMHDVAETCIRRGIQEGAIRPVEPRIAARMFSSVIVGYLFTQQFFDAANWPYGVDRVADEMGRVLAFGVVPRAATDLDGAAAPDPRRARERQDGRRGGERV